MDANGSKNTSNNESASILKDSTIIHTNSNNKIKSLNQPKQVLMARMKIYTKDRKTYCLRICHLETICDGTNDIKKIIDFFPTPKVSNTRKTEKHDLRSS